jgi:hypothetical protein
MLSPRPIATAPFLAALLGCEDGRGEDSGPSCKDEEAAVALEEVTPLGFSAQDVVDLVSPPYEGPLAWADETTTVLDLEIAPTGEAWFVDSEVVSGAGEAQPAIWPICDDRVAVAVTIQFTTADGAFAETWAERVEAAAAAEAHWNRELDLGSLNGDFDLLPFVQSKDYDELRAFVGGTVSTKTGTSGRINGQGSGSEDCDPGDTCSSWSEEVPVATWGDPDPK